MSTCHDLENDSTSSIPACSASRRTTERMFSRCAALAFPTGSSEIGDLEQDVDERAALEVVAVEPLVEDVEDREQLIPRSGTSPKRLGLDELPRPALLAPLEKGEHEILLGPEVSIERRARDAGRRQDLLGPDRANAARREELVRGLENALAGA